MTDYTPINNWTFRFSRHPLCSQFSTSLINTYLEDFNNAVISQLFTDASRNLVATNAITIIRATVIHTVPLTSTADCSVVTPIIKQMLLFGLFGNSPRCYQIRTPATLIKIFNVTLVANKNTVTIQLNPAPIFVNNNTFNVMNFTGVSLRTILHINIAGVSTSPGVVDAATYVAAAALTPT